jgi:hypothetical protein
MARIINTEIRADDKTRTAIESAKSGMRGYQSTVNRRSRLIETSMRLIRSSFALVATGAIALVAGLGMITTATARSLDETGKFADRLGVTTEALSQYKFIADLSGISTSQLENSFEKMSRNIGEAAVGTSEATEAFELLGLSASDLLDLSPDAQFEAVAQAMDSVESSSLRTSIAMDIFGRSGGAMLQVMESGSEGIRQMKEEAIALGIVVTGEQTAAAAEFNDSWTRVGAAITGVRNGIGLELMPQITSLANQLAVFIAENREEFISFFTSVLTGFVEFVNNWITGLNTIVGAWSTLTQSVGNALNLFVDIFRLAFAEIGQIVLAGVDFLLDMVQSVMEAFNFGGIFDDTLVGMNILRTELDGVSGSLEGVSTEAQTMIASLSQVEPPEDLFIDFQLNVPEEAEVLTALEQQAAAAQRLAEQEAEATATRAEIMAEQQAEEAVLFEFQQAARLQQVAANEAEETRIRELEGEARLAGATNLGANLVTIGGSFGEAGLAIQKAIAIRSTIIETWHGAQQAFSSLAGIPIIGPALGAAAAAAAIAAGFIRVQAITSESSSAGGGGSTPSVSLPSTPASAVQAPASTQPSTATAVNIRVSTLSTDAVDLGRTLSGILQEAVGDGFPTSDIAVTSD